MTLKIKRVVLKGTSSSSRRGAYMRVVDSETKKESYYKVAGKNGAKTIEKARSKFNIVEQKRLLKSEEDATLHFRVDYSSKRSGHTFNMKDSHITARVGSSWSDERARDYLRDLFLAAFEDQFGEGLASEVDDDDIVEGLERGKGRKDEIKIKYNYGGDKWKQADTKPARVKDIIAQKEKFFYRTLRRSKK